MAYCILHPTHQGRGALIKRRGSGWWFRTWEISGEGAFWVKFQRAESILPGNSKEGRACNMCNLEVFNLSIHNYPLKNNWTDLKLCCSHFYDFSLAFSITLMIFTVNPTQVHTTFKHCIFINLKFFRRK